jgi:hypothetical protein
MTRKRTRPVPSVATVAAAAPTDPPVEVFETALAVLEKVVEEQRQGKITKANALPFLRRVIALYGRVREIARKLEELDPETYGWSAEDEHVYVLEHIAELVAAADL